MSKFVMKLMTRAAIGAVAVTCTPAPAQVLAAEGAPSQAAYRNIPTSGPGRQPQATASKLYVQASIIPAATFTVGTSLSGGPDGRSYGDGLMANDVDNEWGTCTSCDMDFAVFVFSNEQTTTTVEFKMVSPSNTVVYHYNWTSDKVYVGGNWFSIIAKGNYSAPGTYFAEMDIGGQLDGWVPVVFSAK